MTDSGDVWGIIRDISYGKTGVFDESQYDKFLVGRAFGLYPDTVLLVQEINERALLSKKQHYDFLFNVVRKRKRFAPWPKRKDDDNITTLQEYFNCSRIKAIEAARVLKGSDIEKIRVRLQRGGINTE